MSEPRELTTFLAGFGGFHGATWDELFPFARATCADRLARENGETELDAADFDGILRETSDRSRFFASFAARFCRRYDADISRRLGFEIGLMFSEFDLPAGHAGTADFILATMLDKSARKLLALSAAEDHRRLTGSIRERFASYDGLVPYPEDAVREWLAEPVERWGPRRALRSGRLFRRSGDRRAALRRHGRRQRCPDFVRRLGRLESFRKGGCSLSAGAVPASLDRRSPLQRRGRPGRGPIGEADGLR